MADIGEMMESMRDRRHRGRGVLPTMLRLGFQPPVTYQEAMESVQDYVPDELKRSGPYAPKWGQKDSAPTSSFSSLSGSRSARHDLKGVPSGMRYPNRVLATDADAPDMGYMRTDSIDGRDPIQGGSDDLPEPVYASPAHRQKAMAMQQLEAYGRQMAASRDPRELAALGMAASVQNATAAAASREIAMSEQKGKEGLAGALEQLEPVLQRALERGDWGTYESSAQAVLGQHLKDKDGVPFAAQEYARIGRESAASAVYMNARNMLEQHNGLAGAPPETALAVQRSIAYLHPFQPKNPANVYERRQYINTLGMKLNTALNQANDPEMRDYLNALAAAAAYYQSPWE